MVTVEASGSTPATTGNNVPTTLIWNGYGNFWKFAVQSEFFALSPGIVLINTQNGQSQKVNSLYFDDEAAGDRFGIGLESALQGHANGTYVLVGTATFQIAPAFSFYDLIAASGAFSTTDSKHPLGPGPQVQIVDASRPPAEIELRMLANSTVGRGMVEVSVLVNNIGGQLAENVVVTLDPKGRRISRDSPQQSLVVSLATVNPGETKELVFRLIDTFDGQVAESFRLIASTDFTDGNSGNNSVSAGINSFVGDPQFGAINASFSPPTELLSPLTPGRDWVLPLNLTSTASGVAAVVHLTTPPGIYLHNVVNGTPGPRPPGFNTLHVEGGRFWVVTVPAAAVGTVYPIQIHFTGQSLASGPITATIAPGTAMQEVKTQWIDFLNSAGGPIAETGGLIFEDTNDNGLRETGEVRLPGWPFGITVGGTTFTGVTDVYGELKLYLPSGAAVLANQVTTETYDFEVPTGGFFFKEHGFKPRPRLKAVRRERVAADGSLRLILSNEDGTPVTVAQAERYEVQTTSNLGAVWSVLFNVLVVENGVLKVVDPAADGASGRFYRLLD